MGLFGNFKARFLNKKELWTTNDIKIIDTGPVSGHYSNPNGLYHCTNDSCRFGVQRYHPQDGKFSNTLQCPICGSLLISISREYELSRLEKELNAAGRGNPAGYEIAKKLFAGNIELQYYKPGQYPYKVPSFEYLLDVATKINDQKIIALLKKFLARTYLIQCPEAYRLFNYVDRLQEFLVKEVTAVPVRQADLYNKLASLLADYPDPSFTDPSYYFYVWRQFGIVKVKKVGRYNMVYK